MKLISVRALSQGMHAKKLSRLAIKEQFDMPVSSPSIMLFASSEYLAIPTSYGTRFDVRVSSV